MNADLLPALGTLALIALVFYLAKRTERSYRESKEESESSEDRYASSWFEWEARTKSYVILILGIIVFLYYLLS